MINLRRYESVTLHDLMQGFRMAECDWLVGGGAGQTDDLKRRELLQEFSWWFYASFVGGILRVSSLLRPTGDVADDPADDVLHHRVDGVQESTALLPTGRLERPLSPRPAEHQGGPL